MWLISLVLVVPVVHVVWSQDPTVTLPQGSVRGIKLLTEAGVRLNAFLGVPYALPPIGDLRFAPPERHPGWNKSLFAGHYRSECPQLLTQDSTNNSTSGNHRIYDEDCLFVNIYAPESSIMYRNTPVLIFFHGVDHVIGSPVQLPVEHLASEGVIVVTANYRLNVFGFLSFNDEQSRGNLGLLDQYLTMMWVRDNIQYFGGDSDNVTLMGHGSGASSVAVHMTSPRTRGLFRRVVMMSGSAFSPWQLTTSSAVLNHSRNMARSVGCYNSNYRQTTNNILTCMRIKSTSEILKSFENIYLNGNWSKPLGPICDDFLPASNQYLPTSPTEAFETGRYHKVPVLSGLTVNDGTSALYNWKDLLTKPEHDIDYFIRYTAIPSVMKMYGFNVSQTKDVAYWNYFEGTSSKALQLLKFYSEAMYTAPFWKQVDALTKTSDEPIFIYRFLESGPDYFELQQKLNLTISSYGSELSYLLGPTLFEQLSGRRFNNAEERLSRIMRRMWSYFVRTGNPTPNSYGYNLWEKHTIKSGEYLVLYIDQQTGSNTLKSNRANMDKIDKFWNQLLVRLQNTSVNEFKLIKDKDNIDLNDVNYLSGEAGPYKNAMFTLLAFLLVLLVTLIICLILLKRRTKERDRSIL